LCTAVNRFPENLYTTSENFSGMLATVNRKGYGDLIARARDDAGLDVNQLAERIARKPSTVRRLESEETEPSVEQINALVAALPISAEELLRLMGVSLTLPAAARLPKALVDELAGLTPEQQHLVLSLVRQLPKAQGRR